MLRIALCDDNKAFLEYEKGIIKRYLAEKDIDVQCDLFLSGGNLLSALSDRRYDLYILDYSMDGLNGFETASGIYEQYPRANIAFATNYYNFTRDGYKYHAVRYLLKQENTFQSELEECMECVLKIEREKKTLLKLYNCTIEVEYDDIIYIKSEQHYIEYIIRGSDSVMKIRRCSLDDAQKELPEFFVRVHQRYIVNMRHAIQVQREEIIIEIDNKTKKIPIARNRSDEVYRKFCLTKGDMR